MSEPCASVPPSSEPPANVPLPDGYKEAKVGKYYHKVPNAGGSRRWSWKFQLPGCPIERAFTRKDYFNKHLDICHGELKLWVRAFEPAGRKRGPEGR
jgi:hypothetical protein